MKSEGKENIKRKKERMQSRRKRRKIDLTYLKEGFLCPIKNQDTFLIRFGYGFFPYKKRILISYGKMHNSVSLKRIIYMETP